MPKGVYTRTEKHKKIMSIAAKSCRLTAIKTRHKNGWWKDSEETKKKMQKPKSQEHINKMRMALTGIIRSEEFKQKHRHPLSIKSVLKRTKTRLENAKQLGYYHSDKTIKKILSSVCKRPNKFETNAMKYLNVIYGNNFRYTGDGTMIINHKSVDAFSEKLNIVVLFNGIYWHLVRFGYKVTEEAKRIVEAKEAEPFLRAGYKVIFIWEDELNSLFKKEK